MDSSAEGSGCQFGAGHSADPGGYAGLGQALGEGDGCVPPRVRVMNQAVDLLVRVVTALPQGLVDDVQDPAGLLARRGLPARDPAREGVQAERDVDRFSPGGHVGEVGDPEPVRAGWKSRLTRSPAPRPSLPGTVVRTRRPRVAPASSAWRIRRSTVQRATSMPSRRSWCQTLRAP